MIRVLALISYFLFSVPVFAQVSACTNAGLTGMQAQLCPIHANITANLPAGGQISLATIQGLFTATVANGGIIPTLLAQNLITSAQSTTLTSQVGSLTNTATSLRALLLAINTAATPNADFSANMVTLINNALPSGSALGISADTLRKVLKELAYNALRWNIGGNATPQMQYYSNLVMYSDISYQLGGNYGPASPAFTNAWLCQSGATSCGSQGNGSGATLDASGAPSCSSGCTATAAWQTAYPSSPQQSVASCTDATCYKLYWEGAGDVSCTNGTGTSGGSQCTNQTAPTSLSCTGWQGSGTTCKTRYVVFSTQVPGDLISTYWMDLTMTAPASNIHFTAPASLQYQGAGNSPCTAGTATTGGFVPTPCMWMINFVQTIGPYTTLRLMDGFNVINAASYKFQDWKQRNWPTAAFALACQTTQGSIVQGNCEAAARGQEQPSVIPQVGSTAIPGIPLGGLAYEDATNLANVTGHDIWITIPQGFTDNAVCRLARLLKFGESGAADNGSNCSDNIVSNPSIPLPCASSTNFCADEPAAAISANRHFIIEVGDEPWNSSLGFGFDSLFCFANGVGNGTICPNGTFAPSSYVQTNAYNGTTWSTWYRNGFNNINGNCGGTCPAPSSCPTVTPNTGCYAGTSVIQIGLTARNAQIFKNVFGAVATKSNPSPQPRMVYNDNEYCPDEGSGSSWDWAGNNYPINGVTANPNTWLYAVVGAPYWATAYTQQLFSGTPTAPNVDSQSLTAIFSDMNANVLVATDTSTATSVGNQLTTCHTNVVTNRGIKQASYEGGVGMVAGGTVNFTASISGTTLTVTAISAPQVIPLGSQIDDHTTNPSIVANGTTIEKQLTGTSGGIGTYQLNYSQTVGSRTIFSQLDAAVNQDPRVYTAYITNFNLWDTLTGTWNVGTNGGRANLYTQYEVVGAQNTGSGNSFWGAQATSAPSIRGGYKVDAIINLTTRTGDLNFDGVVDASDCAILMSMMGQTNSTANALYPSNTNGVWWRDGDINGDGVVDAKDLAVLNAVIEGAQCP